MSIREQKGATRGIKSECNAGLAKMCACETPDQLTLAAVACAPGDELATNVLAG